MKNLVKKPSHTRAKPPRPTHQVFPGHPNPKKTAISKNRQFWIPICTFSAKNRLPPEPLILFNKK